jgi:hypothetical protein
MASPLPEPVRRLLRERVESYEHLEALLLLFREPGRDLSVDHVGQRLGIEAPAAAAALRHLEGCELLVRAGGDPPAWRFRATSAALAADVAALAQAHETARVAVMEQMSANAIERMRTSALRSFAEAFRLKGRPRDG